MQGASPDISSVGTRATIEYFVHGLSFGVGTANQTNLQCFMTSSMPFDGVGSSGLGRYYGKYGFDSLSPKSRQVNPGVPGRCQARRTPARPTQNTRLRPWASGSPSATPTRSTKSTFSDGANYAIQDFWQHRTSRFYPLPRYHDLARDAEASNSARKTLAQPRTLA
jgi:hypothetical protein